jgi:hypothetical protein
MAAGAVSGTEARVPGAVMLFQSPINDASAVTDQYDVIRGGQRFVFALGPRPDQREQPPLTVIVN